MDENTSPEPRAFRRSSKLLLAAFLGVAAGGVAAARAATTEPFLDVSDYFVLSTEGFQVWGVRVAVRGGARVTQVRVEVPEGVHVTDWPMYGPIAFDGAHDFKIQIPKDYPLPVTVRVLQLGPVSRTYLLSVADPSR